MSFSKTISHSNRNGFLTCRVISFLLIVFEVTFFALPSELIALPEGAKVESGEVTINQASETPTLNITASDQAIIQWNSFNIAEGETVNFIQPLSSATVLNQVLATGGESVIAGALNANGTVFIINPSGIHFTSTAYVNVGSLLASTLPIQSHDFLKRNYEFSQTGIRPGYLIQEGQIVTRPGGFAALIAGAVKNQGTIQAHLGSVVLASGEKATVSLDPNNRIFIAVDKEWVSREGGFVELNGAAVNRLFDLVVNNEGVIETSSAIEIGGHVELIAASGGILKPGLIKSDDTILKSQGASKLKDTQVTGNLVLDSVNGQASYEMLPETTISVSKDVTFSSGVTVNASDSRWEVGGDWVGLGTFNSGTSAVDFRGTNDTRIKGSNTFYDFISRVPDKKIFFESGQLQTILGLWKLEGAYGRHVKLLPTDPSIKWKVDPSGSRDITYTWVEGSMNINPERIIMTESTNRDASINWDPTGTWNAAGAGNVSSAANWTGLGGAAPGAGDDLVLNGTSVQNMTWDADATASINSVSVNAGYTGTVALNREVTVTGLMTVSAGTVQGSASTLTLNGGLTVSGGIFTGSTGTVDVNGNLILSSGTLTAPSGTLSISGDFTHSGGTFTHNSGAVNLDGANQTLSGATTFNNLTKQVTTSRTLTFPSGAANTQTIAGTLTLQGTSTSPLALRSDTDGTQWRMDPQGTRSIDFLDVKDSNNVNATRVEASGDNFTDSGNNTNWRFARILPKTDPGKEQTLDKNSSAISFLIMSSEEAADTTQLEREEKTSRAEELIAKNPERGLPQVPAIDEKTMAASRDVLLPIASATGVREVYENGRRVVELF